MADFISATRAEFTDNEAVVEGLIAEGNTVVARVTCRGDVPAPYAALEIDIWPVANGQSVE